MTDPDALAAFVAAHPPRPGFTADRMIDAWEHFASVAEVEAIATDASDKATRGALKDEVAVRRQLAATVRWVQKYHGDEVADAFVTYLGDASSETGGQP